MNDSHQMAPGKEDNELDLQLLNTDQKEDVQEEDNWLSGQFNRLPYAVYKFWLVLTFLTAISIQQGLVLSQIREGMRIELAILSVSSILALIGCGEMLFAMMKRRSAFAQKSLIKLQCSIIGALFGWSLENTYHWISFSFEICVKAVFPATLIIAIIGGFAVLRTFKNNHPLARSQGNNQVQSDFLEQNGVITTEISKYDEQLERWPYLVYRFWLKSVIVIEIIAISTVIINEVPSLWKSKKILELGKGVFMLILCSLVAFCCYEMEVVLRTKKLEKSKKALFHLKICILLSILYPAIKSILSDAEFLTLKNLRGGVILSIIPLITIIGAFHANKIIEQRDRFAKVSSYSGDNYL